MKFLFFCVQVVKKGKFGDMHNEREAVSKFHIHLRDELKNFLDFKVKEIIGVNSMALPGEPQNLMERICGMDLLDAFSEMYKMLQNMKQEACKLLPQSANLINFSDVTMNALIMIRKDRLMSQIFHIILSCAPLKALGHDDIVVLGYLGFGDAIKEIINSGVQEQRTNTRDRSQISPVAKCKCLNITLGHSRYKRICMDRMDRLFRNHKLSRFR